MEKTSQLSANSRFYSVLAVAILALIVASISLVVSIGSSGDNKDNGTQYRPQGSGVYGPAPNGANNAMPDSSGGQQRTTTRQ